MDGLFCHQDQCSSTVLRYLGYFLLLIPYLISCQYSHVYCQYFSKMRFFVVDFYLSISDNNIIVKNKSHFQLNCPDDDIIHRLLPNSYKKIFQFLPTGMHLTKFIITLLYLSKFSTLSRQMENLELY